jgi:hypothetical protein
LDWCWCAFRYWKIWHIPYLITIFWYSSITREFSTISNTINLFNNPIIIIISLWFSCNTRLINSLLLFITSKIILISFIHSLSIRYKIQAYTSRIVITL